MVLDRWGFSPNAVIESFDTGGECDLTDNDKYPITANKIAETNRLSFKRNNYVLFKCYRKRMDKRGVIEHPDHPT